jgi:hypothetical protein
VEVVRHIQMFLQVIYPALVAMAVVVRVRQELLLIRLERLVLRTQVVEVVAHNKQLALMAVLA